MNNNIDIDSFLVQTPSFGSSSTLLSSYEEEDLIINCYSINEKNYLDFYRDVKDLIISNLIENATKILTIYANLNCKIPQTQPPLM